MSLVKFGLATLCLMKLLHSASEAESLFLTSSINDFCLRLSSKRP